MTRFRKGRRSPWQSQVRDENGVIRTRSFTYKKDALEWETEMRRIRNRVRAGLERPKQMVYFLQFSAEFLRVRQNDVEPGTFKDDEAKLRKVWVPKFGARVVSSILTHEIVEELNKLQSDTGISNATRNRHRALLHTLFEAAKKQGLVPANPVSAVELKKERKKDPTTVLRRQEEVEAYILAAYDSGEAFGCMATLLQCVGLRVGEALALRHADIDFENSLVRISQIRDCKTGELKGKTKTTVEGEIVLKPLFPRAAVAIRRLQAKSPQGAELLFTLPDGTAMQYWHLRRRHSKWLEVAGIDRKVTIHNLRHSFASLARASGFDRDDIRQMLGHKSASTTDGYVHEEMENLIKRGRSLNFLPALGGM